LQPNPQRESANRLPLFFQKEEIMFQFSYKLKVAERVAASSDPIKLLRLASPTSFRTAESRTFIVEGESDSMAARHSINKDRVRGRLAQKANRSSRALA
jgi:hypothetical protein